MHKKGRELKMNITNEQEITRLLNSKIIECKKYVEKYNNFLDMRSSYENGDIELRFKMVSEEQNHYYQRAQLFNVYLDIEPKGEVISLFCEECNLDLDDKPCIHNIIALRFAQQNYNEILKNHNIKIIRNAKDIIDSFKNIGTTKKMVELTVSLNKKTRSRDLTFEADIKIGINKQYKLKQKLYNFLESYDKNHGKVIFGKEFTYDPKTMFFSDTDVKIIENMSSIFKGNYGYNYNFDLSGSKLKQMLDVLRDTKKTFAINIDGKISQVTITNIFTPKLSIKDNKRGLIINLESQFISLTPDNSYVLSYNQIYFIEPNNREYISNISNLDNIEIEENDVKDFDKYVIPNLRKITKDLEISENLKNNYKFCDCHIKLYFDMEEKGVSAKIKANYNDIVINALQESKKTEGIIRDTIVEQSAIDYILSLGFEASDKKHQYILKDEDKIIKFLDTIKNQLLYETYTTEKLKSVKYIQKTNIKSMFSLGSGELLSCDFDIDGIEYDEIVNIMQAMKYKKKYYRLKNGSILDVETDELKEMNNLIESLDIDLKNGKDIKIPKYKALYISKKQETNNLINTNDTFDKFINNFKDAKKKKIEIIKPSDVELRDYQESGIRWLTNIANYGFGGILADEMGLGKTLQTIMFIASRLKEDKNREILIVCPTSLIYNWESEFNRFAPSIKVKVIADVRSKREQIFQELKDYQVFITSYGLLREDIEKYEKIQYDTMIIDEAQAIKNVGAGITQCTKKINAHIRIALTGTPIENSLVELYSIFDFIMPGFFNSATKFQAKYNNILKAENKDQKNEFNKLIEPFILRRKKIDVVKELPDKIEENILVELDKEQKKTYLAEAAKINDLISEKININTFNTSKLVILQYLMKLRQICISPSLCYEGYQGSNAKIDLLVETLKNAIDGGHKILVFSQFTQALAIVKEELAKNQISYYYLDGSTKAKDRLGLVNEFNKSRNVKVFLISLKAGGNGLNLTGADIVIHLDPWWNPAVEDQATDRAHRIGQEKVVQVIKLIAKGTIEEKIVKLQEMKKELSKQIIEGKQSSDEIISKLSEKDIRYIFGNEK